MRQPPIALPELVAYLRLANHWEGLAAMHQKMATADDLVRFLRMQPTYDNLLASDWVTDNPEEKFVLRARRKLQQWLDGDVNGDDSYRNLCHKIMRKITFFLGKASASFNVMQPQVRIWLIMCVRGQEFNCGSAERLDAYSWWTRNFGLNDAFIKEALRDFLTYQSERLRNKLVRIIRTGK